MTASIKNSNTSLLTAIEARKFGIQINDTLETSAGTFLDKKGNRIFVKPVDWIIDKHSIVSINISHNHYKRIH